MDIKQCISIMFDAYKQMIKYLETFDNIKEKIEDSLTDEEKEVMDFQSSDMAQKILVLEQEAKNLGYSFIHSIYGDVIMIPSSGDII